MKGALKIKTLVTAKDEKELKMRVDDLKERGFKVIKTFEPEHKYGTGYEQTYVGNKYDKKIYASSSGYVKHRVLMERV